MLPGGAIQKLFFSSTLLAATLSVCGEFRQALSLTRFTYTEYLMGEDTRIVVYARDKAAAQTACKAAFDRIAELDAMMSDYRKDSGLCA